MAQCEAHYDCCGWVNYFLHSGHLQIEGRKMSKSLKNFVTIREVLDEYRPEAVRFLFLLHKYHEPMEYSQNTMAAAADLERRFSAFSVSLRSRLREASEADAAPAAPPPLHKRGAEERQLSATLHEKRAEVDAALRSSVDTPAALKALEQLIRATNSYLGEVGEARRGATLLTAISRYFHKTMCCFGVDFGADAPVGTAAGSGSASPLQLAKALGAFRDEARAPPHPSAPLRTPPHPLRTPPHPYAPHRTPPHPPHISPARCVVAPSMTRSERGSRRPWWTAVRRQRRRGHCLRSC